ncbi:MAG: tail fiber domain-containing protein [Alistipes sp.]|nr:tail fiber domain-containing protein [Alistipes sp.]
MVDLEAYDYIQTKRLVYATNIGWFQISGVDEHDNGVVTYKTVKAESYQSVLKNKGFISEERVYCFYNPNDPHDDRYDSTKEDSIPSVLGQWSKQLGIKQALGQGLSEPTTPYDDWTVTYIHSSLIYAGAGSKCRTFKESVTYGYDWMVNDVEEAFEVVILFDFMYKTIHVMTPNEVAQRVNVIYTFNNFMKSVDINEASEDIVTVLNCNGDNCDITTVNPTGTNYICDFSYYMDKTNYRWMSSALIEKLEQWKKDCDDEKDTYEGYVENIRTLYQSATEKETLLQEMSLSLADLRTAQNKRTVLGSGKPGSLCGIVTAESVKSYRTTKNGVETVVGGRSIMSGTDYYSTDFTGAKTITAYQFSPKYNEETRRWDWSQAGATKKGTADEIVAFNLSDDNTSGVSYWYFSDVSDNSSYCKLQSAVTVNKDSATSTNYCGGFDRYIAYTYPSYVGTLPRKADLSADDTTTLTLEDLLNDVHNTSMSWSDIKAKYSIADDAGGTTVYTDKVSVWINLRESRVDALNIELCGYALKLNGYQMDKAGEVINPTSTSIYGRINTLQAQISSISSRLNILSYFADTPTLLRELNCYWIEGDYTNDNIAVLEETTPEKEIDLANELLDAGYIELSKVCQPRFSFSLESRDATKQYEFKDQMCLLELGKIITIEKEEGLWYYPALLEISLNLDNSEEFSMTFANAMRLDDWGYTYADLISDASSTSRKVSANWQDILAYSKERAEISSLIKDPLDTTLRASFANMVNQEFTVDKNGILGRKKVSETSDEFEDEQVRLINNLLIFTDDNWETAKTALGKIYYTDDNGNQVTSYGLIAETIIGSLIMGERLKIKNTNSTVEIGAEGISIKKADGTVVFSASPDGSLIVRNYASQSSVDSLEGRMDDAEASIEVQAGQIALKASQASLDALGNRVSSAETSITANANAIKLKASQSSVDSLEGRMDDAESEISQNASDISAKVSQTYGNSSSSFGWSLKSTGFYIYSNGSTVMKVTSSGLEISGAITAGSTITGAAINGGTIDIGDVFIVNEAGRVSIKSSAGNGNGIIRIDNYWIKLESGNSYMETTSTHVKVWDNSYVGSQGRNIVNYAELWGGKVSIYRDGVIFTLYIDGTPRAVCPHNLYITGTWTGSSAGSISSDRNKKNSIASMPIAYDVLFDELNPCVFKYNDGTSDRIHNGFIAQEVKNAMDIAGVSRQEFAALCIAYEGTEHEEWSLRYEEFVSMNTWQIQKLKQRVAELEARVAQLTNKE